MNQKVTIYTVAEEAGVSVSTVSRFLTGSAKVREEKRKRIQEVIDKYNFRPNSIARNLSNQHTKMLGLIMPDVANPFYATVFIEAERHAMDRGYSILLCNTMNDNIKNNTRMELNYIDILLEKQVDGVIMMGGHIDEPQTNPEYIEKIQALLNNVPVVMVNGALDSSDCYRITTKDETGIHSLVNYLVSLKHRKIGFIGGVLGIEPTDRRLSMVRNALYENDIEFNEDWFIESDFNIEAGVKSFEKLLQMRERPTAVICINDLVAIGVINSAMRFGLKIPEDLSVAGFDNIYLTEYITPRVTSIDLNLKELGRLAITTLIEHLEGREPKKEIFLETKLVIRDSCISPR